MGLIKSLGQQPVKTSRKERILRSPHYKNGAFNNIHPTPMNLEGSSTAKLAFDFLFKAKAADIKPQKSLPSVKTDLRNLPDQMPTVIWFGHSSYLIKYQGLHILVDPVFSGHASPFKSVVKSFAGTDVYSVQDLPAIDVLLLTHDHYDHMDFETLKDLKDLCKLVITPLGAGEHLESWGFDAEKIIELDWWESYRFNQKIEFTATPTRHFSGRTLKRNQSLWAGYVIKMDSYSLFAGGDSGYDDQFKKIGTQFGPFDLALLECGQYNEKWPYIHMFPEQTAQAAIDLKAKLLFPMHWGKFILSEHPWTDSIERVLLKAQELDLDICTPMIGEPLVLGSNFPQTKWWK